MSTTGRRQKHAPSLAPSPALPPAGFESLFNTERGNLKDCFEAMVLPIHWSIVRGGLRLRNTDSNPVGSTIPLSELSETLPVDWIAQITTKPEEGTERPMRQLILRYWEPTNSGIHYEAKVLEVVKNQAIVVIFFRAVNAYGVDGNVQVANKKDIDSNSPTRNSAGTNFQFQEYLFYNDSNGSLAANGEAVGSSKSWSEIYKSVTTFERLVWEQLMEPIGLSIVGNGRTPGPYESKVAPSERGGNQQSEQQQQQGQPQSQPYAQAPSPMQPYPAGGIGGPLYVPPGVPAAGGLGRSDLDPIGGFGQGMVADPRGFHNPRFTPFGGGTGSLVPPPGARFDPYGPPNPVPNPVPQRPQPGAGGSWAVPNPDGEEPPPGFDDMFI